MSRISFQEYPCCSPALYEKMTPLNQAVHTGHAEQSKDDQRSTRNPFNFSLKIHRILVKVVGISPFRFAPVEMTSIVN